MIYTSSDFYTSIEIKRKSTIHTFGIKTNEIETLVQSRAVVALERVLFQVRWLKIKWWRGKYSLNRWLYSLDTIALLSSFGIPKEAREGVLGK